MQCKKMKFAATLLTVGTMLSTGCGKMGLPPAGPPDVEVVEVVQKDVPITKEWVATLDGLVNAQIHAPGHRPPAQTELYQWCFCQKGRPAL